MWYYVLHMDTVHICSQSNNTLLIKLYIIFFFKRLTTLNDSKIDKDLLLILNLYPATYDHDFLIVLIADCRRWIGGTRPYGTL